MYKEVRNTFGELTALQREDGWQIPIATDNKSYQKYLEWVAEGNTPEPADSE